MGKWDSEAYMYVVRSTTLPCMYVHDRSLGRSGVISTRRQRTLGGDTLLGQLGFATLQLQSDSSMLKERHLMSNVVIINCCSASAALYCERRQSMVYNAECRLPIDSIHCYTILA